MAYQRQITVPFDEPFFILDEIDPGSNEPGQITMLFDDPFYDSTSAPPPEPEDPTPPPVSTEDWKFYNLTHSDALRVAHYDFRADVELGYDYSGFANHASIAGIERSRPLFSGSDHSAHFDGNAYMHTDVSDSLTFGGKPFIFSCWINPYTDGTIIESDGSWGIGFDDGKIVVYITDQNANTVSGPVAEDLGLGHLYHILVAFDRDTKTIAGFVNGQMRGQLSISSVGKIESGDIEIGRGVYGYIGAYMDNISIEVGVREDREIMHTTELGQHYDDFESMVLDEYPALFVVYGESDFEPEDLSMDRYDIDDSNLSLTSYTEDREVLWSGDSMGVSLDHTGYLTIQARDIIEDDDGTPPEPEEDTFVPEPPPAQTGYLPTVEFIVNGLDSASGTICLVEMEGSDDIRCRVSSGNLFVEERENGTVVDSHYDNYGDWAHVVIVVGQSNTHVYINGSEVAVLSPSSRTGFESIRLFGDGSSPYTGSLGPVAIYDKPLTEFSILQHYDTSFRGRSIIRNIEDSPVVLKDQEGIHAMMHDWSIFSA